MALDKNSALPQRHVLDILALLISLGALTLSVLVYLHDLEKDSQTASPNIQIERVEGGIGYTILFDDKGAREGESVSINCKVGLINLGGSSAQIVNISWEPLSVGESNSAKGVLVVTDERKPLLEADFKRLVAFGTNPVLGIKNPTLAPGQTKLLDFHFEGSSNIRSGRDVPNVRITLTFTNGQAITLLPELKYIGVGF